MAPEKSLRHQAAAHFMHAAHDSRKTSAAGRLAFLSSFETAVDPDGRLDPDDRRRRARSLLRATMLRLAYQSAKARRERRAGR